MSRTTRGSELRKIGAYRVDVVISVLEGVEVSPSSHRPAIEDFAGYLLLDALVANTDRHHQNWAVLVARRGERAAALAPTFDHASSLACGLTDDERIQRLRTNDAGFAISTFAGRARSPFADARTLADAVRRIGEIAPQAIAPWRARMAALSIDGLTAPLARIPPARMSTPARDFAAALLQENYVHLIELMEALP